MKGRISSGESTSRVVTLLIALAIGPAALTVRAQSDSAAGRLTTSPPAEPSRAAPGNRSVIRQATGRYRYESISDGSVRGAESWQFFAHPDGSRTMIMWHDLAARHAQFSVVLRVADTFRPLEAYVSYWNGGTFKGSSIVRVRGGKLVANADGPSGPATHEVDVVERFSIGTHPVAGDGWHTWTVAPDSIGVQASSLYAMEATADVSKPVLGSLTPLSIEYLGREVIDVPAGRFDTLKVRLAGVNELWITPIDRLVVRSRIAARDLQYVLVESSGSLR
jgi:hypothetical protein